MTKQPEEATTMSEPTISQVREELADLKRSVARLQRNVESRGWKAMGLDGQTKVLYNARDHAQRLRGDIDYLCSLLGTLAVRTHELRDR